MKKKIEHTMMENQTEGTMENELETRAVWEYVRIHGECKKNNAKEYVGFRAYHFLLKGTEEWERTCKQLYCLGLYRQQVNPKL